MTTQTEAERLAEVMELRAELFEQARIIGMGAERELSAMSRVTALEAANAELLEALEAFVAYDDSDVDALNFMSLYANAIDRARAAIAKHQK